MQVAKVLISGNRATVQDLKMITSGTVGATVAFEFDETWDGFSKTYVYKVEFKTRDVVDESGIIPPDLLTHAGKWLQVGVYGTKGDVVLPTVWAGLGYICAGVNPSGDPSTNPQLPVWAQLQQGVEATNQNVEELEKNLGKAVQVEPQDFTEEQQAQARENIGAVSQDDMAKATGRLLAAERDFPVVCSASGEVVTVHDASDHALKGLTLYGKTTQDGTPTPETPIDLVSVGDSGSVGVKVCGKNLLKNTATTQTINGVTFTVNDDSSITVNGTATADANLPLNVSFRNPGSYFLSGAVDGTSLFCQRTRANGITNYLTDAGNGVQLDFDGTETAVAYYFKVAAGTVVSNVRVYPMLRLASEIDSTYEPYKDGGAVTLSTPNGLPGIPVSSGGSYTDANGQQWISDYKDPARGVYVQRVYPHTFTESDVKYLQFSEGSAGNSFVLGIGFTRNLPPILHNDTILCAMSDIATGISNNDRGNRDFFSVYCQGGDHVIFRDSPENTRDFDTFKAGLPGKKIIYALATPIETPLPAEEIAAYAALHTNKPNTTVYTDSNAGIKLDYVADTKAYIDNKFAELAAAIVNNT